MEVLIKNFLKIGSGSGSGSGYGDGDGSGSGSGYGDGDGSGSGSGSGSGYGSGSGSGYGYGDGDGDGDGDGSGSGYGDGDGSGSGSGYGDGDGDGSGSGDGDGYGVNTFNNQKIYRIDGVATLIDSVKGKYLLGSILNNDLTLKKCYVARFGNYFAHGETLKKALQSAKEKYEDNLSEDEKIDLFVKNFNQNDKYKASVFSEWHHKLTGSCEMGRKSFMQNNGINQEAEYTILEFIEITKNAYNGSIIAKIEEKIKP